MVPPAPRVAVALSGGVDSAVAAFLLAEQGAQVVGLHLRLWRHNDSGRAAENLERQAADAQAVACAGGFPLHILDARDLLLREVVVPFAHDYFHGRTPNPCVLCNPRVKLKTILDWANTHGVERVATGHYVRIALNPDSGRWELRRAADRAKDQSYYLYAVPQNQLARLVTPLGDLTKPQVRRIARQRGLHVAERRESQDVCFVSGNDYRAFLASCPQAPHPEPTEGSIVDLSGTVLGHHCGVHLFTIGQRRGLGLSAPRPLYVLSLDAATQTVVVGPRDALAATSLTTAPAAWVAIARLEAPRRARVQIRYRSPARPALLSPGMEHGAVRVDFDSPQHAVTPGQSAVFYDETDNLVLGGGVIQQALTT